MATVTAPLFGSSASGQIGQVLDFTRDGNARQSNQSAPPLTPPVALSRSIMKTINATTRLFHPDLRAALTALAIPPQNWTSITTRSVIGSARIDWLNDETRYLNMNPIGLPQWQLAAQLLQLTIEPIVDLEGTLHQIPAPAALWHVASGLSRLAVAGAPGQPDHTNALAWLEFITRRSALDLDTIFADSFETGDTSRWAAVVGNLQVSAAAALRGSYGLQTPIGTLPYSAYVQDNTPNAETQCHIRLWFNPRNASTYTAGWDFLIGLTAATARVFRLTYQKSGSLYRVRFGVQTATTEQQTGWIAITNAATAIEITWQQSSAAACGLYVGGVLKATLNNLNTTAFTLDAVRVGPQNVATLGAGTPFFDGYVMTRQVPIGP